MLNNPSFYPTPKHLIDKMLAKVKGYPDRVLEPSAGKGDIITRMTGGDSWHNGCPKYSLSNTFAIEIDETLQATLRGQGIQVIDSDFLAFAGPDKFDLIIGNPPFDQGDHHLLKAIEIMYRGQIVFLLNAETIKNPHTNIRKELLRKMRDLGAEIDYISGAFETAERPTGVEVALVYINIKRKVENDLFTDVKDADDTPGPEIEMNHEVSTRRTVEELVAEYNQIVKVGTETILSYYRNYPKIGGYIGLNEEPGKSSSGDITAKMSYTLNDMLIRLRRVFWRRTLDVKEVRARLTSAKAGEFEDQINKRCFMDFTESNIRQFVLNLIGSYENTLTDAVVEIFDKFTICHCYSSGVYEENIHYFNGWKTNNAFKVGKKVIIPIYGGYREGPFFEYGKWILSYQAKNIFRDIDIVMNYFDGLDSYTSMEKAVTEAFAQGVSSKIVSTYFTITCHKKGTVHIRFNSDDILRRFNVAACRGKQWLPHDYGKKTYDDCSHEEQGVIDSFEGSQSYSENLGRPLIAPRNQLRLAA
jgi:hypothetical protein